MVVVGEFLVVSLVDGDCANATDASKAVPARPAMAYLAIMVWSPSFRKIDAGRTRDFNNCSWLREGTSDEWRRPVAPRRHTGWCASRCFLQVRRKFRQAVRPRAVPVPPRARRRW